MGFDPVILDRFRQISTPGGWDGDSIKKWIAYTGYSPPKFLSSSIIEKSLVRDDIKNLRDDPKMPTFDLCVFILAWGGMRLNYAKDFIQNEQRQHWEPIAEEIRSGSLSYHAGYEKFFELTRAKKIKGCGPAYYTKLLFFLPPKELPRGIIMDQWTARSLNLLMQREVVKLLPTGSDFRVSTENSVEVYESFCKLVAELCENIFGDTSPDNLEHTEMRMFSNGGRQKEPWREYVSSSLNQFIPGKRRISGWVIVFKPDPTSPLNLERHPSSRIFSTKEEAEIAESRHDQRGKAVDIVQIHWWE